MSLCVEDMKLISNIMSRLCIDKFTVYSILSCTDSRLVKILANKCDYDIEVVLRLVGTRCVKIIIYCDKSVLSSESGVNKFMLYKEFMSNSTPLLISIYQNISGDILGRKKDGIIAFVIEGEVD